MVQGLEPCGDAAAVAFEAELAFQGPDDGLDALSDPVRERARRAWSRSPCIFGFARLNPVTVPSQVQISSSLQPQYQREWLGQYP
jgi:hypothetical protein